MFCFVSSHSINTHELRGDFVVGGGAISFVLRLSAHFTKLTLHKQTELLFVQLVHSLFLLVCSFAYVLAQHSDCVCISFFLLNIYPNWAIDFPFRFSTRSRLILLLSIFFIFFLENKIDLLAIIGCHLCITWRFCFTFVFVISTECVCMCAFGAF